jgi:hypothetical protein
MMSIRLPACNCPWCSEEISAVIEIREDTVPKPGDATLCLYCGEWCVFDIDLTLRKPTDDEFVMLAFDETCQGLRTAWVQLKKNQ